MIVKLKSWEDAKKAEAEYDEALSHDTCFGIGRNFLPWGAFIEVSHSWYDEECNDTTYEYDDFFIPSWLVDSACNNDDVLRYGTILIDRSFTTNDGGYTRIRIVKFCDKYFYHNMVNGELVECVKLDNGESKS